MQIGFALHYEKVRIGHGLEGYRAFHRAIETTCGVDLVASARHHAERDEYVHFVGSRSYGDYGPALRAIKSIGEFGIAVGHVKMLKNIGREIGQWHVHHFLRGQTFEAGRTIYESQADHMRTHDSCQAGDDVPQPFPINSI